MDLLACNTLHSLQSLGMTVTEIVENRNIKACLQQFNAGMRTDISRSPSDKNHDWLVSGENETRASIHSKVQKQLAKHLLCVMEAPQVRNSFFEWCRMKDSLQEFQQFAALLSHPTCRDSVPACPSP